MKEKLKEQIRTIVITIGIFLSIIGGLGLVFVGCFGLYHQFTNKELPTVTTDTIILHQPDFLLEDITVNNVYKAICYYDLTHPDIVTAQAILETGYFRSKVFKDKNNLFGLYNSKNKEYYSYNHWSESILAYKQYIQNKKRENEDYFNFLDRIGYAEDSLYVQKLGKILINIKDTIHDKRSTP